MDSQICDPTSGICNEPDPNPINLEPSSVSGEVEMMGNYAIWAAQALSQTAVGIYLLWRYPYTLSNDSSKSDVAYRGPYFWWAVSAVWKCLSIKVVNERKRIRNLYRASLEDEYTAARKAEEKELSWKLARR